MTIRHSLTVLSALSAAALLSLTACGGGGDDNSTPAATTQAVSIQFAPTVGTTALNTTNCSTVNVAGVATRAGATVNARLTDLRFYVSNVKLRKADGSLVPVTLTESDFQANSGSDSVALIDFEDNTCTNGTGTVATNSAVTGTVPVGTYTGMVFTLGVPESLNHADPAGATTPKPISSAMPGMLWSWQSGRKFIRIELSPENAATAGSYTGGVQVINPDGTQATTTDATTSVVSDVANQNTFVYHLGNTGCVANAAATATGGFVCGTDNTKEVTLAAFDANTQNVTIDLQALFAGNSTTQNTVNTSAGCMSAPTDPQCAPMFQALAGATSGSTIFRAIAK